MLSLVTATLAVVSAACWAAGYPAAGPLAQDEDEAFFSGNADEVTAESITVTREILGNPPERRTFSINAQTKVEGTLIEGARVTVKFHSTDNGLVAETIIVREPLKKKKS